MTRNDGSQRTLTIGQLVGVISLIVLALVSLVMLGLARTGWLALFAVIIGLLVVVIKRDAKRNRARRRPVSGTSAEPVIAGFQTVGGHGYGLPVGAPVTLACHAEGITLEDLKNGNQLHIADTEINSLDANGTVTRSGGGFFGGGFGLQGAGEGMAIASVLNALSSKKPEVNTVLRISTRSGEIFMRHRGLTTGQLRVALSALFTRVETLSRRPARVNDETESPAKRLEELARLHGSGVLTDDEFQAARAPLVAQLTA